VKFIQMHFNFRGRPSMLFWNVQRQAISLVRPSKSNSTIKRKRKLFHSHLSQFWTQNPPNAKFLFFYSWDQIQLLFNVLVNYSLEFISPTSLCLDCFASLNNFCPNFKTKGQSSPLQVKFIELGPERRFPWLECSSKSIFVFV
jgi:hypothetical protein